MDGIIAHYEHWSGAGDARLGAAPLRLFSDRSEALEAAGIETQGMDSENVETLRRTIDAGESDGWLISRWFLDRGAALEAAGLPG